MSKKSTSYFYDTYDTNANLDVMLGYTGAGDITKRRADITLGEDFVNAILDIAEATHLQPEYVVRIVLDDLINSFILGLEDNDINVSE